MATKNSLDDMRNEAYRRQDNLASDIDELLDRVHPKNAAERWKNEIVGSVKSFSDAGDGKSPATLPVVIAGGVIGLVVLGVGVATVIALSGNDDDPKPAKKNTKSTPRADKRTKKA